MASQARPWRRLPSMIRPQAPVPPPTTPAPALSLTAMPTFRAASPPPPSEPQPQREPTPPLNPEPQLKPETTPPRAVASPPPPPPPRALASPPPPPPTEPSPLHSPPTRGTTIGSVPSTPVSRPVAEAQVSSSLSSLPPSPAPKRVSAPTSPIQTRNGLPSSSARPPSPSLPRATGTATTATVPVPSPIMVSSREIAPVPVPSPPKVNKPEAEARTRTPPQSPRPRPMAPPPSPLALPPPQIKTMEAEKKTTLVHENIRASNRKHNGGGEMQGQSVGENHKHGHGNGTTDAQKKHHEKKHLDSEEVGMKVITLAGENKGAVMDLIRSPKTGRFLHRRGNTSDENESGSSSSSDEGKQKLKDETLKSKSTLAPPMTAFMNSNVQAVNNSLVFNSSCTHHDPGVHLSFSRKPSSNGAHHHIKDSSKAKSHKS